MAITHDSTNHQFTDGHQAVLAYEQPAGDVINFVHTFVPEAERGQGVGEALAKAGLDYARQQQLHVIASCPFVAAYIQQHQQYANLVQQ